MASGPGRSTTWSAPLGAHSGISKSEVSRICGVLIRHGESVEVVQSPLGHASAAETLDTYSHLWPDSEDRTRLAVDSVLLAGARSTASRKEAT